MHGVQGTLDELGTPLPAVTFVVVDLETTGGSPADVRASPRSARSRCAAARCSASSRPWSTRREPIPPFISVLTGITDAMVADAPAHRRGPPGVPRVRPRRRARRAQRAVRHRLPQGRGAPRTGHAWPRFRGGRHRPPGPAAADPRRGAQPQAVHPRRALRRADDAQPPGAARRAGHRRRAARRCSSGSATSGVDTPRGARDVTPRGSSAAQRRKRHLAEGLPQRPGRLPLPGRARAGSLYVGKSTRPPAPGPHLLHRLRAAHPHGRDGRARRARHAIVVRDRARGRGPRAAADRRAQAALQPPLALPRAGGVGQAHRRGLPPAVASCARSATTAPPTSGRSAHGWRPSRRSRRCTRRSRCASAPSSCRRGARSAACALAEMGRCGAPCTGPQSVEDYAAVVAEAARAARRRRPRRRRGAARARIGRLADAASGTRTPAPSATGCCPGPGRRPGPAARAARRVPRARRRPAGAPTAAGRSSASATAGSPARRRQPRGAPTRCPPSRPSSPPPRSCAAAPVPCRRARAEETE